MFFDFSLFNFITQLLSVCLGMIFSLSIIIISYNLPFYILKWAMNEEAKNNPPVKKSFEDDEDDNLLLSKLFQKDSDSRNIKIKR